MTVALAGKSSGSKTLLRPKITQSHRGRLVRNIGIGVVVMAFVFMMFSNSLKPKEEELSYEEQQRVEFEMENNINRDPAVEAAPADPFEVRRVAALPSGFEGSDSHNSLLATAEGVAVQVATYSSKRTPEEYVAAIDNIDDDLKSDLLKSSQEMWPEIQESGVNAKGEASGSDPVIRDYNEEATLAKVEVIVRQAITRSDGSSVDQTRAYLVTLVGAEQDDGSTAWTAGGIQAQ